MMKKEKSFLKAFFDFSSGIMLINVCFIITSLPFFLAYIFVIPSFYNLLIFGIAALPMGASLAATFGVCRKFMADKELAIVSQFFKDYKTNFKSATHFWSIQLMMMGIFSLNYRYVTQTGNMRILFPLYLIGIFITLLLSCYAFPILSRFEMKIKHLYLVSFSCLFRYYKVTLLNIAIIIAAILTSMQFSFMITLLIFSITCYFITYSTKDVLITLEEIGKD